MDDTPRRWTASGKPIPWPDGLVVHNNTTPPTDDEHDNVLHLDNPFQAAVRRQIARMGRET